MKNLLVAAILALSLSLCNLGDRLKDLGKREQNSNQSGNSQPGNQNSNQSNTDVAEGDDVPPPPQPGNSNGGSGAPISGGVLNARAVSLPKPAYPKVAKAAGASGTVTVQVLVDETGKVTSARAVTGHPLLREAAVQAAYQARFSPTKLSGKPVKVTGVINYNFVPE
ncbi:MAG TPA: TonB family protein [Pyrinomonadaceae bacterium]|nr:TonB family protein [Pyrinomonadaceae bacterium]